MKRQADGALHSATDVRARARTSAAVTYVLSSAVIFAAYFWTAKIGLALDAQSGIATTVWPPSGIALGALLLRGNGYWPAIALAAFGANLSVGVPIQVAAAIAVGNTLEPLLGAYAISRFGRFHRARLDSVRDTLALIGLAAVLSTTVSAGLGVSVAFLGHVVPLRAVAITFWNWWIGDLLGVLLVTPLIVSAPQLVRERWSAPAALEALLTVCTLTAVSAWTFGMPLAGPGSLHIYLVFPPLLWAALRFRQAGAAAGTFLVASIAVVATVAHRGPFVEAGLGPSLLALQTFMSVVAITALVVGSVSSDRQHVASELQREHAFVSTILDTASLLVVTDPSGRIVRVNRALERTLGGHARSPRGRSFWEILARPSERETVKAAFEGLGDSKTPREWETTIATADGGERIVAWSNAPLLGAGGVPEYVISSGTDLTERRQLEAQLALSDRLAAVGTLAAGIGHEINNPLAYMMLSLELAHKLVAQQQRQQLEHSNELERLIGVVRDGAERVRLIVSDLRTLARSDDHSTGAVDLRGVLDTCLRMADAEIRHRAQLVTDYEPVPLIEANQGRLGQVFLNLLINAAQAIPEGRAESHEIRVAIAREGESKLSVTISDTGCGIEPAVLRRLFEPFFTTKPPGQGTGLGLSVCHSIIESVGGSIAVESAPGQGTTFRVLLPLIRPIDEPIAPRLVAVPSAPPLNILIIEDEEPLAHSLGHLLEEHHVTVTSNGRKGVALAEHNDYQLILCDLLMPDYSGIDVYEDLRRLRPGHESRIAFMTGGTFTPKAEAFLARIPNPSLQKPFVAGAVLDLVSRATLQS